MDGTTSGGRVSSRPVGSSRRVRAGCVVAALVVLVALPARPDGAAAPLAPQKILDRLCYAVQTLASKGRKAEVEEALDVMRALGEPAKDLDALKQSSAKTLAKSKAAPPPIPDVAKTLARIASDLAAQLAATEGDAKKDLARQILRL